MGWTSHRICDAQHIPNEHEGGSLRAQPLGLGGQRVGITKVRRQDAEPAGDERSRLRAVVGSMHCVPLAAIYAAYVASCLVRGEQMEDMEAFEARLRQYFVLGRERSAGADRPIIIDGIVYGVWFNDKTRRFIVDPAPVGTGRVAVVSPDQSSTGAHTSVDRVTTEPSGTHTFPQRALAATGRV
jgi:hypothetical protein